MPSSTGNSTLTNPLPGSSQGPRSGPAGHGGYPGRPCRPRPAGPSWPGRFTGWLADQASGGSSIIGIGIAAGKHRRDSPGHRARQPDLVRRQRPLQVGLYTREDRRPVPCTCASPWGCPQHGRPAVFVSRCQPGSAWSGSLPDIRSSGTAGRRLPLPAPRPYHGLLRIPPSRGLPALLAQRGPPRVRRPCRPA